MTFIDRLHFLTSSIHAVGLKTVIQYYLARIRLRTGRHSGRLLHVRPKGVAHPIALRAGSTDLWVFNQIFLRQEYRPAAGNLGTVLDLGANIGLASIYFLHRNPLAQVVAVEPDPDNYNLCVRNLKPYGDRAQVVLGAVWSESTRLVLSPHEDGKEWAVRVTEPSAGCPDQTVQGWSVPELLDRAGIEDLDLLKVDIEGSELALFSNSCEGWLPRVRNAVIELHGPACEDAFRQAMAGYQFEQAYSGELVLCRNIQRRDHQRKD